MYEKFTKFSKYLLITVIWFIIYLFVQKLILSLIWNFDISSYNNWKILNTAWQSGWKIDTFYEWAFMIILLTFIPLYFTTLAYILHPETYEKIKETFLSFKAVKYIMKFIPNIKKEIPPVILTEVKQQEVVIEETIQETISTEIPAEIMQGLEESKSEPYFKTEELIKEDSKEDLKEVAPVEIKSQDNISDILSRLETVISKDEEEERKKEEKEKEEKQENYPFLKQQKEFEKLGYTCLQKANKIDLICLSKQKILFINFVNLSENWMADEELIGKNEPVWIGQNTTVISPVYQTIKSVNEVLEKTESVINTKKQSVIKIVCLLKGVVQNEEDMQEIWKEKRIYVLNEDTKSNLKKLSDFQNVSIDPADKKSVDQIKNILYTNAE